MQLDYLFYIFLTILFSAFFSGLEIAFVSSNKLRFELDKKQRNLTSSILSVFYNHPQQYISTMLVGNNISLVIYGLLMAQVLEPYLLELNSPFIITLLQTLIAGTLVLITGEFLPKMMFRINPNLWMRIFALPLLLCYIITFPVSRFTTWLSILILRICRIRISRNIQDNAFSRVDLNYLIQESFDGQDNKEELEHEVKIFQNALDFSKVKLRDCYVPRTEIVGVDYDTEVEVLRQVFVETGLSKIAIFKGNIDNIVGYIHSSEMFSHQTEWRNYIKPIPIVPENMAAQRLMKLFMLQKKSIALVVDEFGGTAGIITLEDIIEEIFGEIEDEHDSIGYTAEKINDHEFLFSGRMEVESINTKFDLAIPESDAYETIAGFILHHHQHFPKLNEVIRVEGFTLKCMGVTNNRIELIKLSIDK